MQKPTICTKLPGTMREFGNNCGIEYVDTPEDVVERALSLSHEDIQRLKQQAKQHITDFDWNTITARFEQMLTSLIENGRMRSQEAPKKISWFRLIREFAFKPDEIARQ